MPRAKPDEISVVRLELGGWERERLKRAEMITSAAVLLPGIGIAALGIGAAGAGYALYQWLKTDPFQPISDFANDVKDFFTLPTNDPVPFRTTPYTPADDPTGQDRGFWELIWDSTVYSFQNPWWSNSLPDNDSQD